MFPSRAATHNGRPNGRNEECVARLTMEDILAHLRLLLGEKDAWYHRQVNL